MDLTLKALSEPHRRAILQLVAFEQLSAGEIAEQFSISRPAVSQHLGVLKAAGLISEERKGTKRLYQTRPEGFTDLRAYIDSFWDESL
ncbi:MAG: winged helix-turn-helix transcriptional regulator, partial [Trueperaceae bacterium]|nr:winged helix-turn-helix transcriptional regulator [Trueperaceae bacterium]